ncbi:serine/threonine-protein kinase [Actinocorallia populi]|uniref:serine/threonine-protein kinase n=1 Tax=Actinocorallia populi TaxID=2079200 RepID=UPI000D08E286|nr:serine/threonine-protein kinase [Actinocorallia populi]
MAEPLRPGDPHTLGRFALLERLGEGGQGIVYLGRDPQTGDRVAVKVLKAADAEARERLAREMNAAQRVRLQYCISRVVDYSFEGTRPFVVSEFVDGPSLFERVAAQGPLRGGDLERLLAFTAQALVTIHGSGVVHRDLKPANVLLGPDGPRVVDFGIARPVDQHTLSGAIVGTPAYIAPEQLQGQPAGKASDVWAWACTMVFAATGYPPFGPFDGDGDNIAAVLGRIMHAEPRLGHGLEAFEPLLRGCLDKDPARRPSARRLREELEADLEHEHDGPQEGVPVPTPAFSPSWPSMDATVDRSSPTPPPVQPATPPPFPVSPPPTTPPPLYPPGVPVPRRRRRKWPAVLLALAVLLGAGGWFGYEELRKGGITPGGDTIPAAFAGTWTGGLEIRDAQGGERYYEVQLTLFEGQRSGGAQFTGEGVCNGTLGVKAVRPEQLELDLTDQNRECPNGTVRLSPEGEGLSLAYAADVAGTADGSTSLSKAE